MKFIKYLEKYDFKNVNYDGQHIYSFLSNVKESSDFEVFYNIDLCYYTLYIIEAGTEKEKDYFLNYISENIINTYIHTILRFTEDLYINDNGDFFYRHLIKNNLFVNFLSFLRTNQSIYTLFKTKLKFLVFSEGFIENIETYFSENNGDCLYHFIFDFMIFTKTNPFVLSYVIAKQSKKIQYKILNQMESHYNEKIAEVIFSNKIRFNHFFNILKFEEFKFFFLLLCRIFYKNRDYIMKNNDFIVYSINNNLKLNSLIFKNKKEQKNTIKISLFFLFSKEILDNTGKKNHFSIINSDNLIEVIDEYIPPKILDDLPPSIRKAVAIRLFDFLNNSGQIIKYIKYYEDIFVIPSFFSQNKNITNLIIYDKNGNIQFKHDYNSFESLKKSLLILNNFSDSCRKISNLKLNLFKKCDFHLFLLSDLEEILAIIKNIISISPSIFDIKSLYYDIDRVTDGINSKKINLSVTSSTKKERI